MTYKPEIDGLRGIAVLFVLLCHMQLGMTGGYIGVDVFFVISGFLITTIVMGGITKGKFSFWEFYGKRFVRLYPALIVIVTLTFVVGFLLADPVTLKNLARTGKYALWSVSNLFYSKHQGYFDFGVDQQLFLHTWSLGVEWQFYLVWPVLVWLALKVSRKALLGLLCLIALGSLVASQTMLHTDAVNAYYQMPSRAFELGIGGLLVFVYGKELKPLPSALLTLAGVGVIVFCAWFYTPYTPFPGLAALWPCLGAAACIYGGKGFSRANGLRWPALVYIGKISYSVYLVHWPLLLFYRYYMFRPIELTEKFSLVAVSLILGAILYHGVEMRVNWRRLNNKKLGCGVMLGIMLMITPIFHYTSKYGEGLPERLGAQAKLFSVGCVEGGAPGNYSITRFGAQDGKRIAYLTGDSFSAHYRAGFDATLAPRGEYIEIFYSFGCFVAPAYTEQLGEPSAQRQVCVDLYNKAVAAVKADRAPLILSQDWLLYYLHEPIDGREGNRFKTEEAFLDFIDMHLATVKRDIGDNKLVLLALPNYYRYRFNIAQCVWRPAYLPQVCKQQIYQPYTAKDTVIGHINQQLKVFAEMHEDVYFIDVTPAICPDGICTVENDLKIYNDGRHYSRNGSRVVVEGILSELEQALAQNGG